MGMVVSFILTELECAICISYPVNTLGARGAEYLTEKSCVDTYAEFQPLRLKY